MQVALENNIVFVVIEYLAILCWGLSGGLAAIRKGYDIFTIMLCGWLTALGGGLVRDVMLGALPPVGITDKGYVLTTLFSGIIVVVAHPEITKLKWTMTVIDALGLGLFAVSGTAKALAYGSSGMTAVFLGMFTALAGGLIRDIFIGDVPMIIRDKPLCCAFVHRLHPDRAGMARRKLRLVRHALGNAARRADRHHRGGAATALGRLQRHSARSRRTSSRLPAQRKPISQAPGHSSARRYRRYPQYQGRRRQASGWFKAASGLTVFKEVHLAFCRMLTAFKEVPEARNAEYKCCNDGVYSWFFPYSVPL